MFQGCSASRVFDEVPAVAVGTSLLRGLRGQEMLSPCSHQKQLLIDCGGVTSPQYRVTCLLGLSRAWPPESVAGRARVGTLLHRGRLSARGISCSKPNSGWEPFEGESPFKTLNDGAAMSITLGRRYFYVEQPTTLRNSLWLSSLPSYSRSGQ